VTARPGVRTTRITESPTRRLPYADESFRWDGLALNRLPFVRPGALVRPAKHCFQNQEAPGGGPQGIRVTGRAKPACKEFEQFKQGGIMLTHLEELAGKAQFEAHLAGLSVKDWLARMAEDERTKWAGVEGQIAAWHAKGK